MGIRWRTLLLPHPDVMASILLLSGADPKAPGRPHALDPLGRMCEAAASDRFGVHHVTDDPETADVILFVENCGTFEHFFREVRQHPYYRAYRDKCFVHTRTDYPVPFLPGVYTSLRKRWYDPQRVRAGMYLVAFDHEFTQYDDGRTPRKYLYSFIGKTNTHPVREQIMRLEHPDQFLFDTTPYWPYGELPDAKQQQLETQYQRVSLQSKFILCPRGYGTSSIRLFEALRMGRVPVILSDAWVPPVGPSWEAFSLRVAEADTYKLPEILMAHEADAIAMGYRAREAWEHWFARDAIFHRVVEWCLEINDARNVGETLHRLSVLPQLADPRYLRLLVKTLVPRKLLQWR